MMKNTKIYVVGAVADVGCSVPVSTCWSLVLANYEVACVGDSWAERDTGQNTINITSGGGLSWLDNFLLFGTKRELWYCQNNPFYCNFGHQIHVKMGNYKYL